MSMASGRPGSALRQLRNLFSAGTATGLTDRELLDRFQTRRAESDEAAAAAEMAFAALVDRHGAMVWGVCRRLLRDVHEAEDAFQATFLILVRKAGSVRVEGSLGRWLYGVAHRVARRARNRAVRRAARVMQSSSSAPADPSHESELEDLRNVLDQELDRLPPKYRCPVELCHLQGLTYDEAARQLNWPVATVKSRLTRGRRRLRERLVRRGLAPGAVAAATALTSEARSAVPQTLVHGTVRSASMSATGVVPAAVIDLVEGALKMMAWEKLKLAAVGVVVAVGLGFTAQALSPKAPIPGRPAAPRPQATREAAGALSAKTTNDHRWVRRLPNGATIEIIGVSSIPTGSDTWWRPDGTPLHPAPCDRREPMVTGDKLFAKSVVVRVTGIPAGADQDLSITEAQACYRGPAKRDDKVIPELTELNANFTIGTRAGTVRFQVASDPWHTEVTAGKSTGAFAAATASYIFGDAIPGKEGTLLAVTHNVEGMALRVLAIDVNGKEHPGGIRSSLGVTGFQQIKIEFDLPPDQIRNFLLQTRPYQKVEIPGIRLERKAN
jgi:RNA polymerase sigma factor (sigma-70 family)